MMEDLAALPEEERQARLKNQADIEYRLPDDKLRAIILSRINVWMDMDEEVVKRVAASLDTVMTKMPSTIAMKRIGVVQTVSRDFPLEQQEKLRMFVPGAFPQGPDKAISIAARLRAEAAVEPAREMAAHGGAEKSKKPFWKFW